MSAKWRTTLGCRRSCRSASCTGLSFQIDELVGKIGNASSVQQIREPVATAATRCRMQFMPIEEEHGTGKHGD